MNPTDLFLMRAASVLNHSLSYAPFNWSAPPENKGIASTISVSAPLFDTIFGCIMLWLFVLVLLFFSFIARIYKISVTLRHIQKIPSFIRGRICQDSLIIKHYII